MNLAVGFDFDHTLGLDHRLEKTVIAELLAELGEDRSLHMRADDGSGVERLLHEFRSGASAMNAAVARYFATHASGRATYGDVVDAFRTRCVARAREFVEPIEGACDVLAELDELHVPYAILTNGWSPLQEAKAAAVGFHASVFVSEVLGFRKPSAHAFGVLAEHFNRPPGEIWFVGDDPRADCGGALAFGMQAVWFDWEGKTYPGGVPQPTHVIHRLHDLVPVLQGRASSAAKRTA